MKLLNLLYKYDNEYLKILFCGKIFNKFFCFNWVISKILLFLNCTCNCTSARCTENQVNRCKHPVYDLRQVGVYSLPVGVSVRRLKHNFQSMVVQKYKIYLTYPNFWGESY